MMDLVGLNRKGMVSRMRVLNYVSISFISGLRVVTSNKKRKNQQLMEITLGIKGLVCGSCQFQVITFRAD